MIPLRTYQVGKIKFLAYPQWMEAGVLHGFTGADMNFAPNKMESYTKFCHAFGAQHLFTLRQVHGTEILDLRGKALPEGEVAADGMILPIKSEVRMAFGIKTADCMPIIIRSSDFVIMLHAGWRGLACGIVQKALELVPNDAQVLVGPCAGAAQYEVGQEVIDAFGDIGKLYREKSKREGSQQSKYLLDLAGTVQKIASPRKVVVSDICTIKERSYHSHRRDGSDGRNLCFFVTT